MAIKINRGDYKNLHGFIAWKDGKIVVEKYREGWSGYRPHNLQSVTKSITSLLIGAAIRHGYIGDIDRRVLPFFPEYSVAKKTDSHWGSLTLKHLLTMRTGMDWIEHPYAGSPLAEMNNRRNDWIRFVLDIPMKEIPGQTYTYNSGGVILLGGVIKSAANIPVREFAKRFLFGPLDITTDDWWFADQQGLPHTGGGLRMAVKDMLKIGRLVLQCGEWEGKRILNCDYINKLFQNYQSEPISEVSGYNRGYSLLWHVFPLNPKRKPDNPSDSFIAAWGAGGQWIFIIPQHDMIVIFIGDTVNFEEETLPLRILYESLLQTSSGSITE